MRENKYDQRKKQQGAVKNKYKRKQVREGRLRWGMGEGDSEGKRQSKP